MNAQERTANEAEMRANQEAYSRAKEKIYITDQGKIYSDIDAIPANEAVVKQLEKAIPNLQASGSVTGIDIAAYNVYQGSNREKPDGVIVGVAGSNDLNDWRQNVVPDAEYRSRNNAKTNEELLQDAQYAIERLDIAEQEGYSESEKAAIKELAARNLYEFEIRGKVEALQKYKESGIPITLVGDSKGGEDAGYLALKSEQSGIPIDHLYLTNPKGIRINDADMKTLEKMASEGKITKEVVYPESLMSGGILRADGNGYIEDGRSIPVSKTIYTVPNQVARMDENHTISNYENDVYQGVNGDFKFQCDQQPEEIKKGWFNEKSIGYRYKVSQITDKSGKVIRINEYFFEEQKSLIKKIQKRVEEMKQQLGELQQENVGAYFSEKALGMKLLLESQHKTIIEQYTPFSTYKADHISSFEGITKEDEKTSIESDLRTKYTKELQQHVETEGNDYPKEVLSVVSSFISQYQEIVQTRSKQLESDATYLVEVEQELNKSKVAYLQSQTEIQLEIEKFK